MHPGCRIDQVFLCREPVDFRKSTGGLSVLVEQELGLDPFGSALYVFVNRDRNKIKVLYWHRNGFCLWLKRLEAEKFAWPREVNGATQGVTLQQFEWLLEGFDLWQKPPHKTLHFGSVSYENLVNYGMPYVTAKPSNLPPRYSLPELALPTDAAALTALLHSVIAAHNDVKTQALSHMQHMMEQFILARHRMFGASSEQSSAQGRLFDEAEVLAADSDASQDVAPLPPATKGDGKADNKPGRGKRGPLPSELKRVDAVHDVPEAERSCPCGTPMVEIGEDVSEQLDLVPMQVRVLRHIRKRYGCPGSAHAPMTAPLPPQPLPKSNASADLLAMLLVVKFIDGLPLARFESVLARHGVTVPRQTLARWVIGAAGVLQPLLNLMRDALLEGAFLHVDETVVQVLKETGKAPTSNSYMWVQTGGPPGRPVVLFDYDASRGGAGAGAPAARLPGLRDDRRLQRL